MRFEDFHFDGPDTKETREKNVRALEDLLKGMEAKGDEPQKANSVGAITKAHTFGQSYRGEHPGNRV